MKHKFIIIWCAVLIACAAAALFIRHSYVPNGTGFSNCNYYVYPGTASDMFSGKYYNVKASNADDLVKQADAVVECRRTGKLDFENEGLYSTVKVSRVYKGDKSLAGGNIIVAEQIAAFTSTHFVNASNGLVPLKENEDYILLLKKTQVSPYRPKNSILRKQYYLLGNSPFSAYRLSCSQTKALQSGAKITMSDLTDCDLSASNQDLVDSYNDFRAQLFSELGLF